MFYCSNIRPVSNYIAKMRLLHLTQLFTLKRAGIDLATTRVNRRIPLYQ